MNVAHFTFETGGCHHAGDCERSALVCTSASFPRGALWKSDRKFGTNVSGSLRMLVTLNWRWNSPWLQWPELATEEARS